MAIDYTKYLTVEQRIAINKGALERLAAEAYSNELAQKAAEAVGEDSTQFQQNIAVIESVIETHEAELAGLEPLVAE